MTYGPVPDRFGLDAFGAEGLGAAHEAGGLAEVVFQGRVRRC